MSEMKNAVALLADKWRAEAKRYARYGGESEQPEVHAAISKTLAQNADTLTALLETP